MLLFFKVEVYIVGPILDGRIRSYFNFFPQQNLKDFSDLNINKNRGPQPNYDKEIYVFMLTVRLGFVLSIT